MNPHTEMLLRESNVRRSLPVVTESWFATLRSRPGNWRAVAEVNLMADCRERRTDVIYRAPSWWQRLIAVLAKGSARG